MGSDNRSSFTNTFSTRALMALSSAILLGSSACAGDTGEIATADDVGVVQAPVKDGILLTGDDASTNNLVATARHCLETRQEAIDYGWPDTSGSTAALIVSSNLIGFAWACGPCTLKFYGAAICENGPVYFASTVSNAPPK